MHFMHQYKTEDSENWKAYLSPFRLFVRQKHNVFQVVTFHFKLLIHILTHE